MYSQILFEYVWHMPEDLARTRYIRGLCGRKYREVRPSRHDYFSTHWTLDTEASFITVYSPVWVPREPTGVPKRQILSGGNLGVKVLYEDVKINAVVHVVSYT